MTVFSIAMLICQCFIILYYVHVNVQARQNITDVNYHITQYQEIIRQLHFKISHLQRQLHRQQSQITTTGHGSSESAVTLEGERLSQHAAEGAGSRFAELCTQLKTASREEKEIR